VRAARPWAETTIKTLLSRLIQKGAVRSERLDGRLQYRALIDRGTYVEGEVQALAERLFGGDAGALVAYLAEKSKP
jgi:BlaI family penicillinase repressor